MMPNDAPAGTRAARVDRAREWRSTLLLVVMALLVFETLTGLLIQFLPFGLAAQGSVILHTLVGLVFLVPYLVYQLRHWRLYSGIQLTHYKVTGYLAMAATLVACVTGVVLTYQAAFGTRISYAWDLVHTVSTYALLAAALPHIVLIPLRDSRATSERSRAAYAAQKTHALRFAAALGVLLVASVVWLASSRPEPLEHAFPDDYAFKYGQDRPFAPSLASTESGGPYDARTLGGSRRCGDPGCHVEIVEEWEVSAHRWSAMDPAFQAIQAEMAKQNGPESTRYCAGCHDPISLFSGQKTLMSEALTHQIGIEEGVSCLACHGVRSTDVKGNANYVVAEPARYLFELSEDQNARWVGNFLIRAYPWEHQRALSKRLFKTSEYCAACHKQFIDTEINQVGWVQLQNQYDNWKASKWHHGDDPTKTIECRECHMPLVDSADPASGDSADYNRSADDGKHRSHRFLASNQFVPAFLELPGHQQQVELTGKWLRGEIPIPEIEDKWARGPAVGLDIIAPEEVAAGEKIPVKVVITSNKVGHDFPTGPLDIIQSWIHLEVTDASGATVYSSGSVDEEHFIEPGTFMFKAEPVDRYGNLIDRHNLWEMVGVRYKRAVFPGFSDTAEYMVPCPGSADKVSVPQELESEYTLKPPEGAPSGKLTITAKLRYRKIDQYLLNFVFGPDSGLTTPVTVMATTSTELRVRPRTGAALGPEDGTRALP